MNCFINPARNTPTQATSTMVPSAELGGIEPEALAVQAVQDKAIKPCSRSRGSSWASSTLEAPDAQGSRIKL
jgi:hypothetical protein